MDEQAFRNILAEFAQGITHQIDLLGKDISRLSRQFDELKAEVNDLKAEVNDLKQEVHELKDAVERIEAHQALTDKRFVLHRNRISAVEEELAMSR